MNFIGKLFILLFKRQFFLSHKENVNIFSREINFISISFMICSPVEAFYLSTRFAGL